MAPASPALNDDQLMNVAASVIVSPPIGVRKSVRLPPVESISARMRISDAHRTDGRQGRFDVVRVVDWRGEGTAHQKILSVSPTVADGPVYSRRVPVWSAASVPP
jgi:hypothetical protein